MPSTDPAVPPEVLAAGWSAYNEADTYTVSDVEAAMRATYAAGLAAGRTAAAADIRDHLTRRGRRVGAWPPITPDAALRNKAVIEAYETAARIAENGADQ